jgi:hypothetical protein
MAALAGTTAPQSSTWSLSPVYSAQIQVFYGTPPYQAPGGTVYSRSAATVYYPQGCDWGLGQQLPYALTDAQSRLFGFDETGTAAGHYTRHAAAELTMQARTATGATYVDTVEYNYVGREEHTAQLAGQLYLSWFVKHRLRPAVAAMPVSWSAGGRTLPSQVASAASTSRLVPTDERTLQTH